jgi:hypothetical protein
MSRTTKTSSLSKAAGRKPANNSNRVAQPKISAAAAFSFLKETKGIIAWSLKDLSKSLNISASDATHVAAAFEMQGYIKPHEGDHQWITTLAGETVSGAKSPRYTPETIENALTALRNRIKLVNQDSKSPYKIKDTVAFGDFLSNQVRVQAADVGVCLVRKKSGSAEHSKKEQIAQQQFLKQLRARSPMLNLKPYEEWMSLRTHRRLLNEQPESIKPMPSAKQTTL